MESSLMKTNQHLMNRFALCIKKTTPYWETAEKPLDIVCYYRRHQGVL